MSAPLNRSLGKALVSGARPYILLAIAALALLPLLNLVVPPSSPLYLPDFAVKLIGKWLCFAILALAIDLVWGYVGILSLGPILERLTQSPLLTTDESRALARTALANYFAAAVLMP